MKIEFAKISSSSNGNMIEGLSGDKFKFDKNGDGPARYNIIHFKQIEPGKYEWVRVGKYLSGELRLNMSGKPQIGRFAISLLLLPFSREIERRLPSLSLPTRIFLAAIQFKLGHPEPPESVCSLPCEVGQAKKYVAGEQCCWHCFNCTQYQVCYHVSFNFNHDDPTFKCSNDRHKKKDFFLSREEKSENSILLQFHRCDITRDTIDFFL